MARCAGDNFYGGSKISRRAAHLRETDCVAGHVGLEVRRETGKEQVVQVHYDEGVAITTTGPSRRWAIASTGELISAGVPARRI